MPIATHELKIVSAEAKKEDIKQQESKEVTEDKVEKVEKTEKSGETSSVENGHKKQSIKERIGTKFSNTSKTSHQKSDPSSDTKCGCLDKESTANSKTGDSKRKDVDESNLTNVSTSDAQSSKGRKSSRKGSKKKQTLTEQTNKELTVNNEEIQLQNVDSNKDNATNTQGAHHRNSNKSCCFCWCCCCSCSCLSVKNNQGKGKENNKQQQVSPLDHYFNGNGEAQPPLEEIRLWGESFDKLMKCPWGRKVFRDFLKCEYSEENILFWLACEDLKMESNPELIEEKARLIYEDYISILSPKEVSLDSRVREIINKNMVAPTASTFDEAQLQIYTLMHRDSYPRFINSAMYRKLAQLPSPSRKGSTA